jgi:hypothetical protein
MEIKDTTVYIILKLEANSKLTVQMYDKRDNFNFAIVNSLTYVAIYSFICIYSVYVLRLIRHPRACSTYDQFQFVAVY